MQISLAGRVAVVTGASRGIGQAIALKLAECGADIAVNYRSEDAAAADTVARVQALGRKAKAYKSSVTDRAGMAAMVEDVVATFGGIDLLVHNAGVASFYNLVADSDPDAVEETMRVNVLGPHHLSKLAIPHMRKRGRADIVFISSIATKVISPGSAPYSMGKVAMEALAETLAKEERENGILVHTLCPGLTDTDMGRDLVKGRNLEIEAAAAGYPFGRPIRPEEVANWVAFLSSDANTFVTGQKIYIDGAPVIKLGR
ncbi:MAG: short-chain dehydrogenase/reductase [Caulobacteraceae bacterium]|nr:short-chain dehydrogenase/reductase [Caulobacteraceae bacterium]